jgi:hypothetical protein
MCNRYEQALRPQALSLALLVLPLLGGAQEASALPKQGSGAGQCRCMCVAPSGVNGGSLISDNLYNSQGYACSAFEGATCNLNNPYTGGVSTGSLIGCQDASKSSGGRITVLSGSVSLGRNVGIRRMTPRPQ